MSTPFFDVVLYSGQNEPNHARAINTPALELIADILEKHTSGVLAEVRERIEQCKSRRKADEALLRQALEAFEELYDFERSYEQNAVVAAIQERLK